MADMWVRKFWTFLYQILENETFETFSEECSHRCDRRSMSLNVVFVVFLFRDQMGLYFFADALWEKSSQIKRINCLRLLVHNNKNAPFSLAFTVDLRARICRPNGGDDDGDDANVSEQAGISNPNCCFHEVNQHERYDMNQYGNMNSAKYIIDRKCIRSSLFLSYNSKFVRPWALERKKLSFICYFLPSALLRKRRRGRGRVRVKTRA